MKYKPEIDGLRALAVLPVILFHAGFELFNGGFVGVDIFLVISGYLITNIIISEISLGKFSILNFYERRARRILPILFFVMFACLPFAWLWLAPSDLQDFGQSLVAISTFSSNFLFWRESGYFDTAAELKPLLHTWSLALEEQYYIIFPIFLLIIWRLKIKFILFVFSLIFLASLFLAQLGSYYSPSASFYLLPTRGWELLIGVFLAFYLNHKEYFKSQVTNQLLSLVGFGMICYSIFFFNENTPFPSLFTLIPTIGTGLLILTAVPKTFIYNLLCFRPFVSIGLISYSAYLWHQPLLAFSRHRLLGELSNTHLMLICFLSLVLARLSWQFIERPFRKKSIISKKIILIFSVLGILAFSCLGYIINLNEGFSNRVEFSNELKQSLKKPSLDNCFDTSFNHSAEQWGCNLGIKKDGIDFILFGDSHALSLKDLIDDRAKQANINVFFTGASGCLPFIGVYPKRRDQYERNCNLLNERVYKFAKQNKVSGIIFSARWSYYTLGNYQYRGSQLISDNKKGPFNLKHSIDTFSKAFDTTVNNYNQIKVPIHLITQPPHQKYLAESLYFFTSKGFGDLETLSITKNQFNKLNEIPLTTFETRIDEINLYNITDLFCDNNICSIGTSNRSFYCDSNHLCNYGAAKLTNIADTILSKL